MKNKDVPDQYNNAVQEEVTNTIETTLAGLLKKGKTNDVVAFFGSAASNQSVGISGNPIATQISNNIVKALGEKFKLPPAVSSAIASALLPKVLGQFSKQVADPKDKSIDMNSVIGTLLGSGKSGRSKTSGGIDFNSILGNILSGGSSKSGSKGGGINFGGILGSILGGGSAKNNPAPRQAGPSKAKTPTSGKKITRTKGTTNKKSLGSDLLGGLLGKIFK